MSSTRTTRSASGLATHRHQSPSLSPGLLLRHIDQRLNLTIATNPDARWLFPGGRGGQPMTPEAIESAYASTESPAFVAGPQRSGDSSCKHRRLLQPRPHRPAP
jgi:hypothetical protein